MCYAEQRNEDIQPSPSQKSRYGFWDVVDTINATGDFVAHSVMDMLNPIKQFNNMWEDANESVRFFREGDIRHGVISTGKTALGALYFLPAFRGVELGIKGGAVVGSRLGFFRNTTTSVNKIAQIESKHPLAGLSSDNVVRLVNELGLETPRDQLVLWSGLGRGNEGIRLSQQYVAKHGGITLEMTPGGSWLNDLNANFPFSMQESAYIWGEVSKLLTKNASGQVRSLLGQVRPQSIYASQELLEVRNNLKILGIEEIYLRPKLDTILK